MYKLLFKIKCGLTPFLPIIHKILPLSVYRSIRRYLVVRLGRANANHEPFDRAAHPDGINVLASVAEAYSLTVSCETLMKEMRRAGLRVNYREYVKNITTQDSAETDNFAGNPAPYNVNFVHAAPTHIHYDLESTIPSDIWNKRYNIFYFISELEVPPPGTDTLVNFFDEFWVPSNWTGASLKMVTDKPVITVPYMIDTSITNAYVAVGGGGGGPHTSGRQNAFSSHI